eukprot:Seg1004.4_Seg1004.2 transcript_id=Seg1004.4_Seg1004.2/GoldUCD/mRNA.D3Y31 product="Sterile alpha motif domain-containing protein 9-like" protein_id=Seg1004.4_Seg1004.2/GoldUCD/D3Y31
MGQNEKEGKDEVLSLIETHGVSEDDYLIFDIEKLSGAWGKNHKGKFLNLGHGKLSTFLVDFCSAERLDKRNYRVKNWKEERKPRRSKKSKASQKDDAAALEESKSEEARNLAPCPPTGVDSEVSSGAEASAAAFPGAGASKEPGSQINVNIYGGFNNIMNIEGESNDVSHAWTVQGRGGKTYSLTPQSISDDLGDKEARVEKLEALVSKINQGRVPQREIPKQVAETNPNNWREWRKLSNDLNNLDTENNDYILIVDKVQKQDAAYMNAFANLPWKIVFDLDANSDQDGFLAQFKPGNTTCGSIVQLPPSQLNELSDSDIDLTKVQWVFPNGQNNTGDIKDAPKTDLDDWCMYQELPIVDFVQSCCKKLDKMKQTFCIILGLTEGISTQVAEMVARKLRARFEKSKSALRFCSFEPKLQLPKYKDAQYSNLPLKFISLGMHATLGRSDEEYLLPSRGSSSSVALPALQYHNMNRRLEVLYKGCENEGQATELIASEEQQYENDQLKSFVSGNPISFTSLHYDHDARRSISKEIHRNIDTMPRHSASKIVTIHHAPGSGGSTIARRVLWDLHEKYPCAIVRMDQVKAFSGMEPEVVQLIEDVTESIGEIRHTCDDWPIILLDGDSRMVGMISERLRRKLDSEGKRAILLRCVVSEAAQPYDEKSPNDFQVDSVLSEEDLEQFNVKYSDYCTRFQSHGRPGSQRDDSTRVFYFPILAMLGKVDDLKRIITERLEIIERKNPLEYKVAILVAYLQKYSALETPASLINYYFKDDLDHKTHQEMAQCFSLDLLNLMVSKKAPNKKKWIGLRDKWRKDCEATDDERFTDMYPHADRISGWYAFQHLAVADQVLLHCKKDLEQLTKEFVETPVLENYNKEHVITSLIDNLFLYNKDNDEDRFTFLMEKLKDEGESFKKAAKKTKDANFYSHAARYFAYKNSDFEQAKHLIEEGLEVDDQAATKERRVRETEGHILLKEMKVRRKKLVKTSSDLEHYAGIAIQKFRKARDRHQMSLANPLIGEVNVWQCCFEWLIKDKGSSEAKRFIMSADEGSFFCGSISECFNLLNQVDQIVQSSQTLLNPARTSKIANAIRVRLIETFQFSMSPKTVSNGNLYNQCMLICSTQNLRHPSEKELIRLRADLMIHHAEKKLHVLSEFDCSKLFEMLQQLVCRYEMFENAQYLMNAAALQRKGTFNIDRALEVITKWRKKRPNDYLACFYEYILCFLKIRGGDVSDYDTRYKDALLECKRLCQGSPQKKMHQFYIKNTEPERDESENSSSIRQLMTSVEFGKKLVDMDAVGNASDDNGGANFFNEDCRRLMLECKGRHRVFRNDRRQQIIVLEQGMVEIGVHSKDIENSYSRPTGQNWQVKFIVCFTLDGPRAKGVKFN